MSEKLDGVRAFWNGHNFYSRNNNIFEAPKWFKEKMPWFPLDGELWMGRK
jgi:DNA ligase-1